MVGWVPSVLPGRRVLSCWTCCCLSLLRPELRELLDLLLLLLLLLLHRKLLLFAPLELLELFAPLELLELLPLELAAASAGCCWSLRRPTQASEPQGPDPLTRGARALPCPLTVGTGCYPPTPIPLASPWPPPWARSTSPSAAAGP